MASAVGWAAREDAEQARRRHDVSGVLTDSTRMASVLALWESGSGKQSSAQAQVEGPALAEARTGDGYDEERSPVDQDLLIGRFARATLQDAKDAIAAAKAFAPEWGTLAWQERNEIMTAAADLISERRNEISALATVTHRSPWHEASTIVLEVSPRTTPRGRRGNDSWC
jgi:delta 1-pyrroline-5-carboxylate dehydrogenase